MVDQGLEQPDSIEEDEVEVVYLDDEEELALMQDYGPSEDGYDMVSVEQNEENVIESINDMSKVQFCKHRGSVFVCALSKDRTLALTGAEDDMAYVWNTTTGDVVLECTGHKDSVTEVSFNHDCSLIVTGDMAGLIQVWSIEEKKLIWCIEGDEAEWIQWHHSTNIIIAGTTSGDIYIYLIPSGNCKVLPSSGFATKCGQLLPDGKRVIVGYSNGVVKLWNIKTASVEWQYADTEETEITSMKMDEANTMVALCPSAQLIKIADGKLIATLKTDDEAEIESCDFQSQLGVLATGALCGHICVWDLGKYTLRHEAKIDCAVTKLKFGKDGKLVIGAIDGVLYVCDARTGLLTDTLTGHQADILDFVVDFEAGTILTASDDHTARMFEIKFD